MSKPTDPLTKVTELEGFYATGDYECFVFGKILDPSEHYDHMREKFPDVDVDEDDDWEERFDAEHEYEETIRVYPGRLLPEETKGRKGRWKITVEFWPDEEEETCPTE